MYKAIHKAIHKANMEGSRSAFSFAPYLARGIYLLLCIVGVCSISTDTTKRGIKDAQVEAIAECFHSSAMVRTTTKKFQQVVHHAALDPAVNIDPVIDDLDIQNVNVMTQCVKKLLPERVENHRFKSEAGLNYVVNNVTHIASFVQKIMPDFYEHVLDAAGFAVETAGWYPHPRHLGVRSIEMLEYGADGQVKYHRDTDSIYTMILMVSDSAEYTGGNLLIEHMPTTDAHAKAPVFGRTEVNLGRNFTVIEKQMNKGGALLVNSERSHAVEKIDKGTRRVVVVEFWPYQNAAYNHLRPSPQDGKTYYKLMHPLLYQGMPGSEKSRHSQRMAKIEAEIIGNTDIIGESFNAESITTLSERLADGLERARNHRGSQSHTEGVDRDGWVKQRNRKQKDDDEVFELELRRLMDSADVSLDYLGIAKYLTGPTACKLFGLFGIEIEADDPYAAVRRRLRQVPDIADDDEIAPEEGIRKGRFVISESMAAGMLLGMLASIPFSAIAVLALYFYSKVRPHSGIIRCDRLPPLIQPVGSPMKNRKLQHHQLLSPDRKASALIPCMGSEPPSPTHEEIRSPICSTIREDGNFILSFSEDADDDASVFKYGKSR